MAVAFRSAPSLGRRPVEHTWHPSRPPGPPRFVLAERVTRFCFEYGFHLFLFFSSS